MFLEYLVSKSTSHEAGVTRATLPFVLGYFEGLSSERWKLLSVVACITDNFLAFVRVVN